MERSGPHLIDRSLGPPESKSHKSRICEKLCYQVEIVQGNQCGHSQRYQKVKQAMFENPRCRRLPFCEKITSPYLRNVDSYFRESLYFTTGRHFPLKIAPSHRGSEPHLIHGSLGPPESSTQTASPSVQPFFQGSLL